MVSIDRARNLFLIRVVWSPTIIVLRLPLENATHTLELLRKPIASCQVLDLTIDIIATSAADFHISLDRGEDKNHRSSPQVVFSFNN